MGIFNKFKIGFKKSASALTTGIKEIIIKKEIDDENLNKIEEFLIQSDVGVEAASEIKEIISTKKIDPKKDLSIEMTMIDEDAVLVAEADILLKGLMYLFQYIQIQSSADLVLQMAILRRERETLLQIFYGEENRFQGPIPDLIVDILQLQNLTIAHQQEKYLIEIVYLT